MSTDLPDGVQRVLALLQERGHGHAPVMLDDAARTALQAAQALGVELGQIAKSIIFRRLADEAAVLVITAGDQRVDQKKVEALVGPLGRADAAFVKARTGFSIGGVPPLAHATPSITLIDETLLRFDTVWAAAGHPHSVFQLHPQDLLALTGAPLADVVEAPLAPVSRGILKQLAARAATVQGQQDDIPSPCISVCRMDPTTDWCSGCFRSIDEIRVWSTSDAAARRNIWAKIAQRIAPRLA